MIGILKLLDMLIVQGDQLYMAVCLLYLLKRDLSSVRYGTVAYTSFSFDKVPEKHGHINRSGCIEYEHSTVS